MKYNISIKKYIVGVISVILLGTNFSGCDLDVKPLTTVEPNYYWKSEKDVKSFLNTIYNSAPYSSAYSNLYQDVYSDDVYNRHSHEASGYLFIQDGLSPSAEKLTNTYNWNFFTIRMVNILLENIEKVPMDENLKKRYIIEARFWRAWDYLYKTIAWGKVPLVGDQVFEYDIPSLDRDPQSEVYNYIISEAKACYEALPASYSSADDGRVTKWAARALQAKAELFAGKYSEAAATARDIIDNGGFRLKEINQILDQKEYKEMDQFVDWAALGIDKDEFMKGIYNYNAVWTEARDNPEYILTRQYMDATGYMDATRYRYIRPNQCSTDGWSSITPTQNLVDAYWTADGKEFTPPTKDNRVANFKAMDDEWIKENSGEKNTSVKDWADARIANNTLKDYPYMQEFRNRDSRLYASILFPYKSWNQTEQGEFTYRFRYRTSPNEQNNESKTGFNWRKMSALSYCFTSQYDTDANFPVIRLAEILLIYAESQTEASGYDATVVAELNKLRNRVGMPGVPSSFGSKEAALEFIRHERRIELAGEGRRTQDIARYDEEYWKKHLDNVPVVAPNGDIVLTMHWSSRMRLKPIPQNAVDLNPSLRNDQNPGYN